MAQRAGVLPCPHGHGAVAGPAGAFGADPVLAVVFPGRRRAQAEVTTFGGLSAGHPERGGQAGPAHLPRAGGGDQFGLPPGQLLPQLAEHGQRRHQLGGLRRARTGVFEDAPEQGQRLDSGVSFGAIVQGCHPFGDIWVVIVSTTCYTCVAR
ncbi:hypothetical protein GCM10029964_065820 [Kibdelosporangium lantanae]